MLTTADYYLSPNKCWIGESTDNLRVCADELEALSDRDDDLTRILEDMRTEIAGREAHGDRVVWAR